MNFHEPQWAERAVTAAALYLGTLTSSILKKSMLQRRLGALEAKLEDLAETMGGFGRTIYRRLGRLEAEACISPNPLAEKKGVEIFDTTNHGPVPKP